MMHKKAFICCFKGENALTPLCWYTCAIITTYQYILIMLGYFEIVSIWALFGPETAPEFLDFFSLRLFIF